MARAIALSPRSRALLVFLAQSAAVGDPTPTATEITDHLRCLGHEISDNPGMVGYELARLREAGLIKIIGQQWRRQIEICSTGFRTATRSKKNPQRTLAAIAANARRREETVGWPKVTKESAASYDRAIRRKVFARHNTDERPEPIQRVRQAYGNRSLTGCAAEMVAA